MNKKLRTQVYEKYNGHCAYCGKTIEYKDMQVDHIFPQHMCLGKWESKLTDIDNLNPTCRSCNHYKRGATLEIFRQSMKTLHERIRKIYICKVAENFGIIKIEPWNGMFYFERMEIDDGHNNFECLYKSLGGTFCLHHDCEIGLNGIECNSCEMNNSCEYCTWNYSDIKNCKKCSVSEGR